MWEHGRLSARRYRAARRDSCAPVDPRTSHLYCVRSLALLLTLFTAWSSAHAQNEIKPNGDRVVIHSGEQLELKVIVDYVGKTLGVRFLYGEELTNQHVELRPSPVELPKAHLLNLLANLLRVRDLAMVEQSPELYRIVRSDQTTRNIPRIVQGAAAGDAVGDSMRMVTHVLPVTSRNLKALTDRLKPFLSSPKAGLVAVPENGLLVVTDYESRLTLLRELIGVFEASPKKLEVRLVAVPSADAKALAEQITAVLTETQRLRKPTDPPPSVRGDILPGSLVLIGTAQQLAEAEALIERFTPVGVDLATVPYTPRYLSVDRARRLIEKVVLAPGSGLSPPASVYPDVPAGRLFVTAESATQRAIAEMLDREDRPLPETQRPLRVYHPKYRKAGELLATLGQLLGDDPEPGSGTVRSQAEGSAGNANARTQAARNASSRQQQRTPPVPATGKDAGVGQRVRRVQGPDFVLTEDEHTNAILAIGSPEFHAQLEAVMVELDRRRPQVLIEMTLVAVTQSDSLDLGVELEVLDLGDAWDFLLFSNFGLSSIDPSTGERTLTPSVGLNGVLLGPDEVPLIIRALATRGIAHVISTPKLLVSDNARATLRNVEEAPFTSVNASDTVATTSFAGFESAGTTLSVTPHISNGDHITLEYELTFSNFVGSSSNAVVPPPRTTNSFSSTVEVPDGHAVVTGGLVVDNDSDAVSEVPLLGRLPLLGLLFQSSSKQATRTKIFAFIKPTILRDAAFEDLKKISDEDRARAQVSSAEQAAGDAAGSR